MRTLLMTLTTVLAASCASQPQAKPVEIDPSNPAAAEAPRPTVPDLGPAASAPVVAPQPAAPSTPPPAHDHAAHGAAGEPARQESGQAAPPNTASPGGHDHGGAAAPSKAKAVYTCPMHPEVLSDKPGRCPKCGMNLVKKSGGAAPDERK